MVKPRIAVKTMGCRLNHAETAYVRGLLAAAGFEPVSVIDGGCTGVIIHTCTVTGTAQRESHRLIRSAKKHCRGPVVVSGCAASIENTDALTDYGADAIVCGGTGEVRLRGSGLAGVLADIVSCGIRGDMRGVCPDFSSTRASVKIQNGCNFRCSYCIVPDARGNPESRPTTEILQEIRRLADAGFREVVLTGVNVACWNDAALNITDLVRAAAAVKRIARIRLSSIEPGTAERGIIDLMAETNTKLCRTLHLPLQSGSAKILSLMRRRYTPEQYAETVMYALSKMPFVGLGADIITGFPGETEKDFLDTIKFTEMLPFSNLHVFPYSERPGTPAAEFPNAVDTRVRRDRAKALIALGNRKREEFAAHFAGRDVEVLVERVSENGTGRGWTSEYLEANICGCGPDCVGELLKVPCVRADSGRLYCIADQSCRPADAATQVTRVMKK